MPGWRKKKRNPKVTQSPWVPVAESIKNCMYTKWAFGLPSQLPLTKQGQTLFEQASLTAGEGLWAIYLIRKHYFPLPPHTIQELLTESTHLHRVSPIVPQRVQEHLRRLRGDLITKTLLDSISPSSHCKNSFRFQSERLDQLVWARSYGICTATKPRRRLLES